MFGEEVCKHLSGGFLAERDLAFGHHRLYPEEHCVDAFHTSEPSPAPNRNSSCGVHPHMGTELPSPVKENALQAKHLRCRTHQPIILQSRPVPCSTCKRTTSNTLPSSDAASKICITPGFDACDTFLPLEQPDQPRTHSEKTSQSLQSHLIQTRELLHLECQITALDLYLRSVTGEILCTHRVRTIPI